METERSNQLSDASALKPEKASGIIYQVFAGFAIINFMLDTAQTKNQSVLPRKRKFPFGLALGIVMFMLLMVGIFVGSKIVIFAQKILEGEGRVFSFRRLFLAKDKLLIGEEQRQIHVLLLGTGGEAHEGGTLTDTMILLTIKLPELADDQSQVVLFSIPRDFLVPIPGYDFRKINSAYAYGEAEGKRQGPALTLLTLEELLGIKIPYYAVIDFPGFQKVIDDLGGIELVVEEGFTDSLFPDDQGGYLPPVTFYPGKQKMDGQTALNYVRSRHGNNNQGTDFARSKRQQQVLKALREKFLSLKVLTNLNLIDRLLTNLSGHLRTNLALHELRRLYELGRGQEREEIFSLSLDQESGLVCDQIVEETQAYVLIPCQGFGQHQAIRHFFQNQFLAAALSREKPSVEIQNQTNNPALASQIKAYLNFPYINLTAANFRGDTRYEESILYDNSGGGKPATLDYLKNRLMLKLALSPFPFTTASPNPDFVIVLAADLEEKIKP